MNLFKNNAFTRWTIILLSFGILSLILWNTYLLSQTFKHEERMKMEIWASAFKTIDLADESTDLEMPAGVLSRNTTIPIVLVGTDGKIVDVRNVDEKTQESDALQQKLLKRLATENIPIEVEHPYGKISIYYGNSSLITKLKYYPIALIAILALFSGLVYSYFRTSKISAENKLWAGMAKETAHQIGTPLSSLLGWVEIMRMDEVDEVTVTEIEKDVARLQTIADRFSKIGSEPLLDELNLVEETEKSLDYLKSRSSKQITYSFDANTKEVQVELNPILHSWTIENLIKNAIDAIKGKGEIQVVIKEFEKTVNIWVTDTGKGMTKSQFKKIFEPGFTTKKRGWGLGLSLTKRIVEDYHKGKIRVEKSELDVGTTFVLTYKKQDKTT